MINKINVLKNIYYESVFNLIKDEKIIIESNTIDSFVIDNINKDKNSLLLFGHDNFNKIVIINKEKMYKLNKIIFSFEKQIKSIINYYEDKIKKSKEPCELPFDTIKIAKVTIIVKRKLQPGDKMSGRHGNKGVVSRVLAEEDMPYLLDGTPVDIVLNPLGVPSRMNVGQIFETNLGWLSYKFGQKVFNMLINNYDLNNIREQFYSFFDNDACFFNFIKNMTDEDFIYYIRSIKNGIPVSNPVFDSLKESIIRKKLVDLECFENGQSILFDGKTGEKFFNNVTVGIMYMLKLNHLVEDKIHARSVGPYSLVTQQPLGGKAQFGGQRLGEMEVWAIEAYGASNTLREFLTVKSDDIIGRIKMYESIVKGNNILSTGIPETFNVLVKELQALSLDISLNFKIFEE